jgi:hypothetical protein
MSVSSLSELLQDPVPVRTVVYVKVVRRKNVRSIYFHSVLQSIYVDGENVPVRSDYSKVCVPLKMPQLNGELSQKKFPWFQVKLKEHLLNIF